MNCTNIYEPQIAILLASYNGGEYIEEQIDSIIVQTYVNWHLFINDDNSNDGTYEKLEQYHRKYIDKITIFHNEGTRGACGNFSDLIDKVSNNHFDLYALCDQDDYWDADRLEKFVECYKNEKKGNAPLLIYCKTRIVDDRRNLLAESFEDYSGRILKKGKEHIMLSLINYIPGCEMLFDEDAMRMICPVPKGIFMHDWWIALTIAYTGRIVRFDNKSLGEYRQHACNTLGAEENISNFKRVISYCKNGRMLTMAFKNIRDTHESARYQMRRLLELGRIANTNSQVAIEIDESLNSSNRLRSLIKGWKWNYLDDSIWRKFCFWWFGSIQNRVDKSSR